MNLNHYIHVLHKNLSFPTNSHALKMYEIHTKESAQKSAEI